MNRGWSGRQSPGIGQWALITSMSMMGAMRLVVFTVALLQVAALVVQGGDDQCYAETCETGEDIKDYQWTNPGLFDDLSTREIEDVVTYLKAQEDLNLHDYDEATPSDAYIFLVERWQPIKSEALAHIDQGQPKPVREARVVIHRGDLDPPVVQEYRVGPLPSPTQHTALKNPKWPDPIPFHTRSVEDNPQLGKFEELLLREMARIDHIVAATTDGYKFNNCGDKCVTYFPSFPPNVETNKREMWIHSYRNIDGGYHYPVGIQIRFNLKPVDSSEWHIMQIWYQGTYFDSVDEVIRQYDSGVFSPKNIKEPEYANDKRLPGSMNFRGDPLPEKPQMGPRSYSPDGRRYKVDGHHVEWQGWSFDFNVRTSSGLMVHDLRFMAERIAYELSMQEVTVFYGGGSPNPMHTNYFDSFVTTGGRNTQLFRGVDCPYDATFFDFVHYIHGAPHHFKNVVCLFEWDKGVPLRRHYDYDFKGGYNWYQGMPDIVLVLRIIPTVYNYDYIIDMVLHQGGQVEMKTTLSGYTLNTFYSGPEMDKYGFQTQADSIPNLHHHVVHFKVDLDILGTDNRLETLDIKLEEMEDPTNPGFQIWNRKIERNMKHTESEGAYQFNFDTPKYLIMYNDKAPTTKFGQKRGYRIAPVDMTKLLLPDRYRGYKAWAWAKYQVATTKRHDDEDRSSSLYTIADPYEPVVNFQAFLDDNENILDQDLVSWISLGAHHIPHTEDVPVVQSPGVQLTFFLLPYNYFDDDVSFRSRDNIRVMPNPDAVGGMDYQYSGVKGTTCCNPRSIDGKGVETPSGAHRLSAVVMTILVLACTTIKMVIS